MKANRQIAVRGSWSWTFPDRLGTVVALRRTGTCYNEVRVTPTSDPGQVNN